MKTDTKPLLGKFSTQAREQRLRGLCEKNTAMIEAIKCVLDELSREPTPSGMSLSMIQGVLAAAYDKATA